MVANSAAGLTIQDVAERLGVHRSIATRLLSTIADHRLISRGPDGRYRAGGGLAALASNVYAGLREVAAAPMQDLADHLGASVALFVAEVDDAVAVVVTEPADSALNNGFFYDLMPPFCVGYRAHGTGDYDSFGGELDVPEKIAEELAQFVINRDIDLAISRRMEVDHGAVQPMEILYDGNAAAKPVVPVFVNSVARPFVPVARVRKFGQAVGEYFRSLDKRVLFIGSGGLSHDPPVPQFATADDAQREFLTAGRHPTPEFRAARQAKTIETARRFAAGEADIMDLNPEWDKTFLKVCASGRVEDFDAYTADDMDATAGHSSHEVRTWVAAYSALRACGEYDVTYEFYRPIPEYIAGFAVTTAVLR